MELILDSSVSVRFETGKMIISARKEETREEKKVYAYEGYKEDDFYVVPHNTTGTRLFAEQMAFDF